MDAKSFSSFDDEARNKDGVSSAVNDLVERTPTEKPRQAPISQMHSVVVTIFDFLDTPIPILLILRLGIAFAIVFDVRLLFFNLPSGLIRNATNPHQTKLKSNRAK
jgi:hypothetical protein